MKITKTMNGNEVTIALEGWLDTQAAPELHTEIESLGEDTASLVFDFAALEYISSSGVREVVSAHKKMNGAFKVKNASAGIMGIFKATGIDKRINFE